MKKSKNVNQIGKKCTFIGTYLDFVTKYVLWDDVLDWERDIKDYGKKKEGVKGQRRLI